MSTLVVPDLHISMLCYDLLESGNSISNGYRLWFDITHCCAFLILLRTSVSSSSITTTELSVSLTMVHFAFFAVRLFTGILVSHVGSILIICCMFRTSLSAPLALSSM